MLTTGDHAGLFLALLLAALMAREVRRYWVTRSSYGVMSYPKRRLLRRGASFLMLETALLMAIVPRAAGMTSTLFQLLTLGLALIFALLSLVPVSRDWQEIRTDLLRESDELTQRTAEQLRIAMEKELRRNRDANARDQEQEE